MYILTRNKQAIPEELPLGLWGFTTHIAHELGHNFRLNHTYRPAWLPVCCPESYPPGHPDFLWDVFELEGENT